MGGRSSSSTTNTNTVNNVSTNTAVGDLEDSIAVIGSDNTTVNVTATDFGAVETAGRVASEAIGLSENVVNELSAFGSEVLTEYGAFGNKAINALSDQNQNSIEASAGAFSDLVELANGSAVAQQQALQALTAGSKSAMSSVERLAQSSATGGQSIVSDSLIAIFKPIGIAFAVALGLWAISGVFKRV
jgi:hypothetical protein